jgi:hypothetical protein
MFGKMLSLQLLVTFYKAQTTPNELKKITNQMDNKATPNGSIPAEHMSVVEANTCYFRGEKAIYAAVPDKTPNGRP